LWSVRPRSILELGSGRSTSYIGDYAMKEGVQFVSIEQRAWWARRVWVALRFGLVDPSCVRHVPVRGDWYDVGRLDRLVPASCDMVFVDGPVGLQESLGSADRAGATAQRWLTPVIGGARILVVDDVHRPPNLALAEALAATASLTTLHLAYSPQPDRQNVVAVSVPAECSVRLREICAAASIAVAEDIASVLPHAGR
jgi:predicted O-methyltransferase YrrM